MRVPFAAALAVAGGALAQNVTCAKGLYMVVARGTNEDEGPGETGALARQVAARIKDSHVEALDYPATLVDPEYTESETEGANEMKDLVTKYHDRCPEARIAVLGYSQGGQVAMDAFCGGTGGDFGNVTALSPDIVENSLVAIVVFGDPSHVANVSYDHGTSTNNGIFQRNDTSICKGYKDLLRSYCDTGDVYCDAGENRTVHGEYLARYGNETVDFIVQRYESFSRSTATKTSKSPGSASPTATAESRAPKKCRLDDISRALVYAGLACLVWTI